MCTTVNVDIAILNWQIAIDHQYTVHISCYDARPVFVWGLKLHLCNFLSPNTKNLPIVVNLDFQFEISGSLTALS